MEKAEINRVLLIQKVTDRRKSLIALLEDGGLHVSVADVANGGVALFQEQDFDVIVIDLNVNGSLDALAAINSLSPTTPIILVSEKITIINVI